MFQIYVFIFELGVGFFCFSGSWVQVYWKQKYEMVQ